MIIYAVAVVKVKTVKAEEEYINRWGLSDWELVQEIEVSNGTKFIFKKHFSDELSIDKVRKIVDETKNETAQTKNLIALSKKIESKKKRNAS